MPLFWETGILGMTRDFLGILLFRYWLCYFQGQKRLCQSHESIIQSELNEFIGRTDVPVEEIHTAVMKE